MKRNRIQIGAVLSALAMTLLSSTVVLSSDEDAVEIQQKRVHRIVVDCDRDSGEDCEQEIRIESLGDDSRVMRIGDHEMVWVDAGKHGAHHYSFGSESEEGGFLGVQLTDLTPELRSHFGVANDEGVMVARVIDDSPAFRAGLAAGDIITRVDGELVSSSGALSHAIRTKEDGETVDLEIWRNGSAETLSPALETRQVMAAGIHHRRVMIDCEDDGEDCGAMFIGHGAPHRASVDCPEGEDCEVKVECRDEICNCTVNGDSVDCEDLHLEHGQDD